MSLSPWKQFGLGLGATFGLLLAFAMGQAQADRPTMAPYTVVGTDGSFLIVTDNEKAAVFFYSLPEKSQIGDDLELKGKIDLKQVGQPKLKPSKVD